MANGDLGEEFLGCDFGDVRLDARLLKIAQVLQEQPQRSLPSAFTSKADLVALYRFCDNDSVTPEKVFAPHIERTRQRSAALDTVLLVQDTTEIDVTRPEQQVARTGPIGSESRRGWLFHPMVAFDTNGVPLGVVGQKSWVRKKLSKGRAVDKCARRRKLPLDEKESGRWLEGLRWAEETAAACPRTRCVCVADSESDIYEIFAEAVVSPHKNLHLLVRAGQNRNTVDGEDWAAVVRQAPVVGRQTVDVRARRKDNPAKKSPRAQAREDRTAQLVIRKCTLQLARPLHGRSTLPAFLQVNIVLCEELDPPRGEAPISWMLVTTLPIATPTEVRTVIAYYCRRWGIEVFFRTLKSGCRIEHRRFETIERMWNALALCSVVAWRVMYLCHLGRECPNLDCEVIFTPSEWKSVYAVLRQKFPARGCPTLNEVILAVARLGGYLERPDQPPGTQTLWQGLQRAYDLSNGWETFGPGAPKKFCA